MTRQYLNFELADDEMQERIEAVKIARCITLENGQLDVWNLSEHAAPYDVILPTIYERIKTPLQECSGSFLLSGIKVQSTQMEEDVRLETLFAPIAKGLFDQPLDFIV